MNLNACTRFKCTCTRISDCDRGNLIHLNHLYHRWSWEKISAPSKIRITSNSFFVLFVNWTIVFEFLLNFEFDSCFSFCREINNLMENNKLMEWWCLKNWTQLICFVKKSILIVFPIFSGKVTEWWWVTWKSPDHFFIN